VHVGKGLRGSLNALTLECWVRPWRTTTHAGLITQYDYREACGIGLFIGPEGTVLFYLGDGTKYRAEQSHTTEKNILKNGRWHHLAATWDGHRKQLWVDGKMVGDWEFEGSVSAPDVPIRLGAYGENGKAAHFLDGDLAMPAIHSRALSPGEIQARHEDRGLRAPMGRDLLACWPLNEERGDRVADVSRNKRYGSIINHGTWMTGGPSFKPDVARFKGYDPAKDPERGHSLRLASDDLYDCRWPVTHEIPIPSGARQGIYVARIGFELDGTKRLYHCTFIVRRAAHRKREPVRCHPAGTQTSLGHSRHQEPAEQSAHVQSIRPARRRTGSLPGRPPHAMAGRGSVCALWRSKRL
jgi:N,N-dimethylformamidase